MDQTKIGHFLKELRGTKKLTQEQLAEFLGVSNRSISRWENGVNLPDLSLLIQIAKYFDVEIDELLDGERKDKDMDKKQEETLLKISHYNNIEKEFFSKRMRYMFMIAFTGIVVYAIIDMLGLSWVQPYESIVNAALGFAAGTLLTGFLYSSRYITKIKSVKARILRKEK